MPRKTRAKYGVDSVQQVERFTFTQAQIERLFKVLSTVVLPRDDVIAGLESFATWYLWTQNQFRTMPTRAEQNAALQDIGRFARDLKYRLTALDKDTEWELMLHHPQQFNSNYLISDLANQLEDFEQAADLAGVLEGDPDLARRPHCDTIGIVLVIV